MSGAMKRQVYAHGRLFADYDELADEIEVMRDSVSSTVNKDLHQSITERIFSAVKKYAHN